VKGGARPIGHPGVSRNATSLSLSLSLSLARSFPFSFSLALSAGTVHTSITGILISGGAQYRHRRRRRGGIPRRSVESSASDPFPRSPLTGFYVEILLIREYRI